MPEFVRVSTPEGHFTVTRTRAETLGLTPLKSDAVDRFGKPLPGKSRVEIDAAKKSSVTTTKGAPSSAETKE